MRKEYMKHCLMFFVTLAIIHPLFSMLHELKTIDDDPFIKINVPKDDFIIIPTLPHIPAPETEEFVIITPSQEAPESIEQLQEIIEKCEELIATLNEKLETLSEKPVTPDEISRNPQETLASITPWNKAITFKIIKKYADTALLTSNKKALRLAIYHTYYFCNTHEARLAKLED